jgi:uncharacterized protein
MFYKRTVLPQLEKEINTKEIVVLTGMRQVGKTTLLKYLFSEIKSKNKTFLDLENPLHRKIFEEENFDNIWSNLKNFNINNNKKSYIFIDEIQNLPEISKAVKYLHDHWQVKFFLTGSISFYLKNLFPESLAGRKIVFELFPLTFKEFLIFKKIKRQAGKDFKTKEKQKTKISWQKYIKYYQEYIEFGGFPKVVLESNPHRKKILLEEVFKSYFEIDVKNLSDFKKVSKLRDLILLLATRVGQRLEVNKLSSELGISRETVYNYLYFLEKTYFINLLPKFSKSIDRQKAGKKKVFFSDTGMANLLGKASLGQLLENSVLQNLKPKNNISYYHKNKKEIDFIVNSQTALEVKTTASQKNINNLNKKIKKLKIKEGYILSLNYSEKKQIIPTVLL